MILRIVLILCLVFAAILVIAATRPNTLRVERSVVIAAPPEKILPLLDDFHNWPQWAPQDREDPTMTRTYSGSSSGAGAVSTWTSKGSAGRGSMTITAAEPLHVSVTVDFIKPFAAHNLHDFTLTPESSSTRVTWTANMQAVYPFKLIGLFVSMDKLIGKHLQSGLDDLKSTTEPAPQK